MREDSASESPLRSKGSGVRAFFMEPWAEEWTGELGMSNYVLVYDADCGHCTKFKQAVAILDTHRRVDFVSLSSADESGLLDGVPTKLRYKSFHLVLQDRQVLSGADALPELISMFPAGRVLSRMMAGAPGGSSAMTFAYSVFVRLHDTGSCTTAPTLAGTERGPSDPGNGIRPKLSGDAGILMRHRTYL